MAGILPKNRPVIRQSSFEKVIRYFFGENWKELYPVVELAIRHPKLNFFDDELAIWTNVLSAIKTFNWNADPSAYVIKGQPKAILKKGVHFFTLSYHHKWNDKKRYAALRPATSGEILPVWRRENGKLVSSQATAIDQHKGGSDSTWSEGCQTTHFSQYPEFIQTIGDAFGRKIPLGVIKKTDTGLMKGVGKFPYILIDQADFNYIIALEEAQFDSAADLKYQAANFVNLPKVEKVQPIEVDIPNANGILSAVEIEEAEHIQLDIPDEFLDEHTEDNSFSAPTANQSRSSAAGQNAGENNSGNFTPETKTMDAPPPSGMLKKAWVWVAGFGIAPPTLGATIDSIRSFAADGTFKTAEALQFGFQIFKFVFPYVALLALVFIIFWGAKEICKQISHIVTIWVNGRADMNNVEVRPFIAQRQSDVNCNA